MERERSLRKKGPLFRLKGKGWRESKLPLRFFFVVLVWIEKTEEGKGFALSFFLFIFARGGLVDSSKENRKERKGDDLT